MSTWAEEATLREILVELRRGVMLLERIAAATERWGAEQFVGGVRIDALVPPCISCGGVGGFHSGTCPRIPFDAPRF